jgi:hypothetical protein
MSRHLASISNTKTGSFVYVPPSAAYDAARTLVKPDLGDDPAAGVSWPVLRAVLRGLRRANPHGRIVLLDGMTGPVSMLDRYRAYGLPDLLDPEMRAGDAESVLMQTYPNQQAEPAYFDGLTAPSYIAAYDCVISVAALKRDERTVSASLYNLIGLLPRTEYSTADDPTRRGQLDKPDMPGVLRDLYFTIGHHMDGAVVELRPDGADAAGQVVWGDDLLAVDEGACRLAGWPVPDYLPLIRRMLQKGHEGSL